jgi:hypothetical protein
VGVISIDGPPTEVRSLTHSLAHSCHALRSSVCCSADRVWFEAQSKFRAGLKLPGKAEGERSCLWWVVLNSTDVRAIDSLTYVWSFVRSP